MPKIAIRRVPGAAICNRIDLPAGLEGRDGKAVRPWTNRAMNRGFDIRNAGDEAEISLYDEIGFWGVTASDFRAKLNRLKNVSRITLRLNSPGGDVFDGIAMHNDLLDHPAEVIVKVTGLAASAASIVAMAGDRVEMAPASFLMIHNAWSVAVGDRRTMAGMQEVLATIDGALAGVYAARTGQPVDDIAELMDSETWLNAERAVADGFADATAGDTADSDAAAQALFDLGGFENTPDGLGLTREIAAAPRTERDFERTLRDAGYTRSEAKAATAQVFKAGKNALRDAEPDYTDLAAAIRRASSALTS